MKKFAPLFAVTAVIACVTTTRAAIVTVNTADNTDFSAGKTNLVTAINSLRDGDTINFNIPNTTTNKHYLITPPIDPNNGYPAITNNSITIDGYSQPGSSPNSNTILAANNAQIRIVLDSRAGGAHVEDINGYGTSESAVLFVVHGTNVHIKGLCFLGPGPTLGGGTSGSDTDPSRYAISFGLGADYGHVSGCRFGLDLDGTSVYRFKDAVTVFGDTGIAPSRTSIGVKPGPADAAGARAQFNVIIGEFIPLIFEGGTNYNVSGNFLNVFPNGLTDYNIDGNDPHDMESFIEFGGSRNTVIGTDGDGLNDAEERNIFGGVTAANDDNLLEFYGGGTINLSIAGNYFGVGVDGVTRFTNSTPVVDNFKSQATAQFGSDFDGVSDAIEGNVIYMNNPFAVLFPTPSTGPPPDFCKFDAGGRVSVRGNKLVNENLVPYGYADGSGSRLDSFTNYAAPFMSTNADIIPILSTTSTFPRLTGTCAVGIAPYTNIIIDVYQLDPEGWENGQLFNLQELITPDAQSYYGFPQGRKYLGSFVDNGSQDGDPAVGKFSFDLSAFDLGPGLVTVTANYSADPPGTHNGRTHTSNFSNPVGLIPSGVSSVGLTHIVPDMLLWYGSNSVGNVYFTNGPVDPSVQLANLSTWEPYISVLGDSTFLIGANTFADDQTPPPGAILDQTVPPFQRFVVTFQPAAGGAPKIGEEFFTDAGFPYRGPINYSRPNGNPQRVAGDKRIGATNFIAGAETSAGQVPVFQSNSRWTSNTIFSAENRYGTVQTYSLDPGTLVQTPLTKAFDATHGRYTSAFAGNTPEVSRFGGELAALDNGNFVVVVDDRSDFLSAAQTRTATVVIITPNGSIVKDTYAVDASINNQIWSNVAAYRGGFCVRFNATLYFYDNNGVLQGSSPQGTSGLSFDPGRGDGTRIASDIRTYYVYLAGDAGAHTPVNVAIWDSRTQNFVASAPVSDTDPAVHSVDRVNLAVDAMDRVCVAYKLEPNANFTQYQVAARVLKFDGTNITYLTHSFFPFVNYENDPNNVKDFATLEPSVAMTTQQICIAAKGTINSTNNPAAGPNTAAETTLYTVISTPAGAAPSLTAVRSGNSLVVSWPAAVTGFTLESTGSLPATNWTPVSVGANNSVTITIGPAQQFYRLRK